MLDQSVRSGHQERCDGATPGQAGAACLSRRRLGEIWTLCTEAFLHWRAGFILVPLPLSIAIGNKPNQGRLLAGVVAFWAVHALLPQSWRIPRRRPGEVAPGVSSSEMRELTLRNNDVSRE
jgi:hypothetical protein